MVEGSAYLVPNPEPEVQGYTVITGLLSFPMAMFAPSGLKSTDHPLYVTVEGSEYLVPKPEFQGYTVT